MQFEKSFKSAIILMALAVISFSALTRLSSSGNYLPMPPGIAICTLEWTSWYSRDTPGSTGDW